MSGRKKVKKKRVEPKIAKRSEVEPIDHAVQLSVGLIASQLEDAVNCLKLYTKKDQIGELANPAIELLTKWGKM